MTEQDQEQNLSIEQEIQRQIDEMDRRFDRSGWFSVVLVVIVLLGILYWIAESFFGPEEAAVTPDYAITSIESLEQRIESLEAIVEDQSSVIESLQESE